MIDEFCLFFFFCLPANREGCCQRRSRFTASASVEFFSLSGFGLPVCPGDKYHEVRGDLSTSVCAAALRKPATEGRGRPENTTSELSLAETPTLVYLSQYEF